MAGALFSFVGGAAGSSIHPLLGALFATSGAILGQMVDRPRIKGQPPLGIRIGGAAEGDPMSTVWGPSNRVEAQIIWYGPKPPIAVTDKDGSCFGPTIEATQHFYHYLLDFGATTEIPLFLEKLWAQGTLVYNQTPSVHIESNQITIETRTYGIVPPVQHWITYWSPIDGPDLSQFESGFNIVVSGASNPDHNGTFRVIASGGNQDGETFVTARWIGVFNPTAPLADDPTPGEAMVFDQTLPEIKPGYMDAVYQYPGGTAQDPDPIIEAIEGPGLVPAYQDKATVLLERFNVTRFSNTTPPFVGQVRMEAALTVADLITRLCVNEFVTEDMIDVTRVEGTVRGVSTKGLFHPRELLAAAMIAYDVMVQRVDGRLIFFSRTNTETVTVTTGLLVAGRDRPFRARDKEDRKLPSAVSVVFSDYTHDFVTGNANYPLPRALTRVDNELSINLPFVLTPAEARASAARIAWLLRASRRTATPALLPSGMHVCEGDRLNSLELLGDARSWRVESALRGANFETRLEVAEDFAHLDDMIEDELDAENTSGGDDTVQYPSEIDIAVVDVAPFADEHATVPGVYVAAALLQPTRPFLGGTVLRRTPGQVDFSTLFTMAGEAAMGAATNVLASRDPAVWDRTGVLDFFLLQDVDDIADCTEEELTSNPAIHRIIAGSEVIAWCTHEVLGFVGNHVHLRVSTLLRGLRDTEDQVGTHEEGERVVMLTDGFVRFVPTDVAMLAKTLEYKAIAPGEDEANHEHGSFLTVLGSVRPFKVYDVRGTRDVSTQDLTIDWKRKSRGILAQFGDTGWPEPLFESSEEYDVEALDGPAGAVVRTWTAGAERSVEYPDADQIADGLAGGGDPVTVAIYQVSSIIGRGKRLEVTV